LIDKTYGAGTELESRIYINKVGYYLDLRDQDGTPLPGGGSVAALAGALAAAMAAMSARFTAGRKKYAAVADEVDAFIIRADAARVTLLAAVDADADAFAAVGAAYAMPKGEPGAPAADERRQAVAAASRAAAAVPFSVLRAALALLEELPRLAETGNANLVSDTGVAAELARAAVAAAAMNVAVNWSGFDDEALAAAQREECRRATARADRLAVQVRAAIGRRVAALGEIF